MTTQILRTSHRVFIGLILALTTFSCNTPSSGRSSPNHMEPNEASVKKDDQVILALLYQQRAAEYRALCFQCYNIARQRVREAIQDSKGYESKKPFAIVTDLDETALDNSGNEAWLYKSDSAYNPGEFLQWSLYGKADSVPGSVSFFNYVNSLKDRQGRKIAIYYISNRKDSLPVIDSTMSQMKQLGFPQLIDTQFLFMKSLSSKEPRRQIVAASHTIILLLGDNLIDLNTAFDNTAAHPGSRLERVDSLSAAWGGKYIVFPNAQYGDWEAALYPGGRYDTLSKEQQYRIQDLKASHFITPGQ